MPSIYQNTQPVRQSPIRIEKSDPTCEIITGIAVTMLAAFVAGALLPFKLAFPITGIIGLLAARFFCKCCDDVVDLEIPSLGVWLPPLLLLMNRPPRQPDPQPRDHYPAGGNFGDGSINHRRPQTINQPSAPHQYNPNNSHNFNNSNNNNNNSNQDFGDRKVNYTRPQQINSSNSSFPSSASSQDGDFGDRKVNHRRPVPVSQSSSSSTSTSSSTQPDECIIQ